MRTALRQHPKAKVWAKANPEDKFVLVAASIAASAALDVIIADMDSADPNVADAAFDWMNAHSKDKEVRAFALDTCKEMYRILA